jgi:hypothetical protein
MSLVQWGDEVVILIRDVKKKRRHLNSDKNVNPQHDLACSHTAMYKMEPSFILL